MSAPSTAPPSKRRRRKSTVVEEVTVTRKVGIIGFTKSREDAPYDDPEWTLAGLNNLWRQPGMEEAWPKCDAWYDLHSLDTITEDEQHLAWLQQGLKSCYVLGSAKQPDWPNALAFPHDEIVAWAKSKGWAHRYFTNSVSWVIAHAHMLLERAEFDQGRGGEIGLWGVDMATQGPNESGEYQAQRPSCEYWLGLAAGAGIKVTISERADILKCSSMYGLEDTSELYRKMCDREKELTANMADMQNQIAQTEHRSGELYAILHQLTGALEDTRYYKSVWMQPEGTRKGGDDPSVSADPSAE